MRHDVWLRPTFIACTAASLGAAANIAWPSRDEPPVSVAVIVGPAGPDAAPSPANADSLARLVSSRDPFRVTRMPAAVRFSAEAPGGAPVPPPPVQRPNLSLAGVMMGSEPTALVDGIPGTEGTRVLRAGERIGDYAVQRIEPDRVVIAGKDTTWTLRVRTRYQ